MRHDNVVSGYPTSTGFYRLTGCQQDPRDRSVIGIFNYFYFSPKN